MGVFGKILDTNIPMFETDEKLKIPSCEKSRMGTASTFNDASAQLWQRKLTHP